MPEVINPFSKEAKQIVENAPPILELPEELFELAKSKVLWKKSEKRPPKGILDIDNEKDVLSYHVLFLSAGLNFTKYSNEVKLVKEVVYRITKDRLAKAKIEEDERFRWRFDDKFDALESDDDIKNPGYKVPWKSLLHLVSARERKLTDWNIKEGYVHSARRPDGIFRKITPNDLIEYYSLLIACEAVEYVSSISAKQERGTLLSIRDSLKGIGDILKEVSEESYRASFATGKSKKFAPDNFPSCIQSILRGVSSGSRNYAICVLLTSFLSYARAAPGKVDDPRLSDFIKDQKVLDNEIMPLIYEGAQRCQPPLFEDQPLEKMNVSYHLGLGLTEDVKLENSGSSKWYVPPNCEKVRRESPALCKPDDLCQKIKNPLNYYFIKMKDAKDEAEKEKEKTEGKHTPSKDNA